MDLFSITKSKLREQLLALYFTNPDKKYYLRELERILKFSVGNIRRELIKLQSAGLFLSESKGNLVYYYLPGPGSAQNKRSRVLGPAPQIDSCPNVSLCCF